MDGFVVKTLLYVNWKSNSCHIFHCRLSADQIPGFVHSGYELLESREGSHVCTPARRVEWQFCLAYVKFTSIQCVIAIICFLQPSGAGKTRKSLAALVFYVQRLQGTDLARL